MYMYFFLFQIYQSEAKLFIAVHEVISILHSGKCTQTLLDKVLLVDLDTFISEILRNTSQIFFKC